MAAIRMREEVTISKHLCKHCVHRMKCLTNSQRYPPCASLGKYDTIQAALDKSEAGDTVYVEPGTYTETITFPKNNIKLIGDGVTFNSCVINMYEANFMECNNTNFYSCVINCTLGKKRCAIDAGGNTGLINYNGNPGYIVGNQINAIDTNAPQNFIQGFIQKVRLFFRKYFIAPYEDKKIKENGDV